jgi:hypothetical protein
VEKFEFWLKISGGVLVFFLSRVNGWLIERQSISNLSKKKILKKIHRTSMVCSVMWFALLLQMPAVRKLLLNAIVGLILASIWTDVCVFCITICTLFSPDFYIMFCIIICIYFSLVSTFLHHYGKHYIADCLNHKSFFFALLCF